jgi:hypothetical protein
MLGSAVPEVSRLEIQSVDHDPHKRQVPIDRSEQPRCGPQSAWWLTRDEQEAADVGARSLPQGMAILPWLSRGDGKCWLLSIVRTTVLSPSTTASQGSDDR